VAETYFHFVRLSVHRHVTRRPSAVPVVEAVPGSVSRADSPAASPAAERQRRVLLGPSFQHREERGAIQANPTSATARDPMCWLVDDHPLVVYARTGGGGSAISSTSSARRARRDRADWVNAALSPSCSHA